MSEIAFTWGTLLRKYRENLRLSQDHLADQIVLACAKAAGEKEHRLRQLHIQCPEALAGYEISRFENDKRIPRHRHMHMLLAWVLLELGAILTPEDINHWLELGEQGWLTQREKEALFG